MMTMMRGIEKQRKSINYYYYDYKWIMQLYEEERER